MTRLYVMHVLYAGNEEVPSIFYTQYSSLAANFLSDFQVLVLI